MFLTWTPSFTQNLHGSGRSLDHDFIQQVEVARKGRINVLMVETQGGQVSKNKQRSGSSKNNPKISLSSSFNLWFSNSSVTPD